MIQSTTAELGITRLCRDCPAADKRVNALRPVIQSLFEIVQ